eukprot:9340400-Ditylum_brightwellii.AAC.1
MFLKQKHCEKIKGRGCVDGRKKRIYKTKDKMSLPMAAVESLMLSCIIDAKEGRDIATVNIPGAFMQADMDETMHMRLEGAMADLLVKLEPKMYWKYLCFANKTIEGQQCTILWHVDDLKISHADPKVVTNIISKLEERYGKEAPLTVNHGKELPDKFDGEAAMPAANHLLEVNPDCKKLRAEAAEFFYHFVAKLLFL